MSDGILPPKEVLDYLFKNRTTEEREHGIEALARPPLTTFLRVNVGTKLALERKNDDYNTLLEERTKVASDLLLNVVNEFCIERNYHPTLNVSIFANGILAINGLGPFNVVPRRKYIYVDHKCGNAVARGSDIFKCGIIASSADLQPGDIVSIYVDLYGKVLRGSTQMLQDNKDHLFLGEGISMVGREIFQVKWTELNGVGIKLSYPIWRGICLGSNENLILKDEDEPILLLQNYPSILTTNALDPQPNELILDMCSAPGNKTRHILDKMRGTGLLVALDASKPRIKQLCKTLITTKQLNPEYYLTKDSKGTEDSIRVFHCDARSCVASEEDTISFHTKMKTKLAKSIPILQQIPSLKEHILSEILTSKENSANIPMLQRKSIPRNLFDRILVDAPCSALGQRPYLGRSDSTNVGIKTAASIVGHHPAVQRDVLRAAVQLLREGGRLVFATCSPCWDECEEVVQLLQQAGMKPLGQLRHPLVADQLCDTIGFFHAVFEKQDLAHREDGDLRCD